MKNINSKLTFINMISGLILQVCTIISGFIVPRVILTYFGSDINGLISSVSQFLSYISLVEGGVGAVIMANLYKPLMQRDNVLLSSIMATSNKFYRRVGLIFIVYTVVLSIAYPIIFKTDYSFSYVSSLILILSISTTIQYLFSINIRTLLNADKKVYIVSFIQIICVILNIIFVLISVLIYPSVHFLKLVSAFVYLLQPIFFNWYARKIYNINWKAKPNKELLNGRWNGFAVNTAAFIHNCTDIALLTVFTNMRIVSIYAVYSLVTNGIKQLISSLTNGINPTLGQAYVSGDLELLNQKLDIYEYVVFVLTTFMYTLTALLITPFVMIYTNNVTDTNYNQPIFGILLVLSEALYIVKFPHLNLAYSANKFKQITVPAYVEAGLNIIISIALVYKLGLIGVTIGTIVAMLYRMVFHVYFTSTFVKGRKQKIFYGKLMVFTIISIVSCGFGFFIFPIREYTITNWIIHGLIYGVVVVIFILIVSIVMFKQELLFLKKYMRK